MSVSDQHSASEEFKEEIAEIISNPNEIVKDFSKPPVQNLADAAEECAKDDPNYVKIAMLILIAGLTIAVPTITVYFSTH